MNNNNVMVFLAFCVWLSAYGMNKENEEKNSLALEQSWEKQYSLFLKKQEELSEKNIAHAKLSEKEIKVIRQMYSTNDYRHKFLHRLNHGFECTCEKYYEPDQPRRLEFINYLIQKDWTVEKALSLCIRAAQQDDEDKTDVLTQAKLEPSIRESILEDSDREIDPDMIIFLSIKSINHDNQTN